MSGWMDGKKIEDEKIDGWMDRNDRWMVGCGWIKKQIGWMDIHMVGWMDKTNRWMVGRKRKI